MSRPASALRLVAFLALSVASSSPTACRHATATPGMQHALASKELPHFSRPAISGETIDTKAMVGRPIVVKFFAKYCEPCKRTLPAVQRFHEEHPDVAFIGIAEDEAPADVQEVVSTYNLTFPVIHDRSNVLSGRFRVSELPVTFVADGTGTIRWVGGPAQSEDEIVRAVDSVR